MADEIAKNRLGRGLAALIGDINTEGTSTSNATSSNTRKVSIDLIEANPFNPRRHFAEHELLELAESIREKGVLQPILVRRKASNPQRFELIAGERRWRASQKAGLHEIPVLEVEATDQQSLEIAIIENIQRQDLNALEEARGYENLIAQFAYSQNDLSKVVGKSRSHIANTLRLIRLPDSVKLKLEQGLITAGHARALLAVADPEAVAEKIIESGLTVRDIEALSIEKQAEKLNLGALNGSAPESKPVMNAQNNADIQAIEQALMQRLGLPVAIKQKGKTGQLVITYNSLDQLEEFCRNLQVI